MGYGLVVASLMNRTLGFGPKQEWFAPHLFLLGLTTLTGLGLLANFWMPMTHFPGLLTLPCGLLAFAALRRRVAAKRQTLISVWFATALVMLIVPLHQFSHDAGLYHLQFMQWIAERPVFLGLGHLQTRFGFDSSWLLFVSTQRNDAIGELLQMPSPWAHYVAMELMIRALLFWWAALGVYKAISEHSVKDGAVPLYLSVALILSVYLWRMKETSTDVAPNIVAIAAWLSAFQAWFEVKGQKPSEGLQSFLAMLYALTFVMISKLSVLPIVLLAIPLWWRVRPSLKVIFYPAVALMAIVALWLIRNLIISGCLVYPAVATCLPVPWSIGVKQAAFEAWDIITFARLNGVSTDHSVRDYVTNFSFHWLQLWMPSYVKTFYFRTACIGVVLGVLASLFWWRNTLPKDLKHFFSTSIVVAALGFIYWLVLGPDPRFSWVFLFIICTSVLTIGFSKAPKASGVARVAIWSHGSGRAITYVACVGLFCLAVLFAPNFAFEHDFHTEYMRQAYRGVDFWVTSGGVGLCGDKIPCATSIHNGLDWIVR